MDYAFDHPQWAVRLDADTAPILYCGFVKNCCVVIDRDDNQREQCIIVPPAVFSLLDHWGVRGPAPIEFFLEEQSDRRWVFGFEQEGGMLRYLWYYTPGNVPPWALL